MDKEYIIQLISLRIRMIRLEKGYSQDKMAEILGIEYQNYIYCEEDYATP